MRISTVFMLNSIEDIIGNYQMSHVVWHWFTGRRYGKWSKKQFEAFLIRYFDGLQVYRLLALYKEYASRKKSG